MLLDPALLSALERLQLSTRRPLAGRLSGANPSKRYGSSLDFADYRDYQAGDDFRRIDYTALARLDQLLVRLYDAEDDLLVRLVVDTSASMDFDEKLPRAAQIAGAIGFVALTRRDAVNLHAASRPPQRFAGRPAWGRLSTELEELTATGVGSLVDTASALLSQTGPPGLTVLCSDLLDEDWEAALRRLPARGSDVVVVHVLGAGELRPDHEGDVDLLDAETGTRVPISATAMAIDEYHERLQTWLDDIAGLVRRLGAAYVLVDTADDVADVVLRGLQRSEVVAQ